MAAPGGKWDILPIQFEVGGGSDSTGTQDTNYEGSADDVFACDLSLKSAIERKTEIPLRNPTPDTSHVAFACMSMEIDTSEQPEFFAGPVDGVLCGFSQSIAASTDALARHERVVWNPLLLTGHGGAESSVRPGSPLGECSVALENALDRKTEAWPHNWCDLDGSRETSLRRAGAANESGKTSLRRAGAADDCFSSLVQKRHTDHPPGEWYFNVFPSRFDLEEMQRGFFCIFNCIVPCLGMWMVMKRTYPLKIGGAFFTKRDVNKILVLSCLLVCFPPALMGLIYLLATSVGNKYNVSNKSAALKTCFCFGCFLAQMDFHARKVHVDIVGAARRVSSRRQSEPEPDEA